LSRDRVYRPSGKDFLHRCLAVRFLQRFVETVQLISEVTKPGLFCPQLLLSVDFLEIDPVVLDFRAIRALS
jgi:hypothetical protein